MGKVSQAHFSHLSSLNAVCLFLCKACAQLSAGGGDVITPFSTNAVTDAALEEDVAEGTDDIWSWWTVVGSCGIDGDAIDMSELLEGCQQLRELLGVRWRIVNAREQDVFKCHLSFGGGNIVLTGCKQFLQWVFAIDGHGLATQFVAWRVQGDGKIHL